MLAKILSNLYCEMGFIRTNNIVIAKRSDLIAEYAGQTAPKTQSVIDSALGGVLFIDEAYSLGSQNERDSYAKECIDTIMLNLSEHKDDFICIVAGYEEDLDKCFFGLNRGLARRFGFCFTMNGYDDVELGQIMRQKLEANNLECNDEASKLIDTIVKRKEAFTNFAGDVELLIDKIKTHNTKRNFGKKNNKILNINDIMFGFTEYLSMKKEL